MREHEGRAGHVTLTHDVGIRLEAFFVEAHPIEHADVFIRERDETRELRYEWASTIHAVNRSVRGCWWRKVGVSRQAELIRILANIPVVPASVSDVK